MEIKKEEYWDFKKRHPKWTPHELLINLVMEKNLSSDHLYLSKCCWVECSLDEPWFYKEKKNIFYCPACKKEVIPIHILDKFKDIWINHGESMDLES